MRYDEKGDVDVPARTTHGTDEAQPIDLIDARNQLRKDDGGTRVHRAEKETDDGNSNGIANDVGNSPDETLEDGGAHRGQDDEAFLAKAVRQRGDEEATNGDAAPESSG